MKFNSLINPKEKHCCYICKNFQGGICTKEEFICVNVRMKKTDCAYTRGNAPEDVRLKKILGEEDSCFCPVFERI